MSDKQTDKEDQNDRSFIIKQIFIKKSDIEVETAPFSLNDEWKPDASLNLDVLSQEVDKDHYNVDLKINVDVKIDKKDIFKIEVIQSGIFEIAGYTDEQLEQLRNSFCANILFPYARQIVSTVTSQAGFPPLIMAPVDFDSRYQEVKAKQEQK